MAQTKSFILATLRFFLKLLVVSVVYEALFCLHEDYQRASVSFCDVEPNNGVKFRMALLMSYTEEGDFEFLDGRKLEFFASLISI